MKNLLFTCLLLGFGMSANAQAGRSDVPQNLEKNQVSGQNTTPIAIIKSATRLFADKNDLTSVIMLIPAGSTVNVVGSDETYLQVVYEENKGFIYASHAEVKKTPVSGVPDIRQAQPVQEEMQAQPKQEANRLTWLENKYGTRVGERIYQGKIWKGMSAEMVKDSWGSPGKISKVISGNIIKEEWFYQGTWLYLQNNVLAEWGPVK